MLQGIDISHWNTKKENCAFSNEDFIIIKASQGDNYIDPQFYNNMKIALENKMLCGAYHFFSLSKDPYKQAKHFVKTVNDYIGRVILVLDWEGEATSGGVELAEKFLSCVYNLTGVKPLIYMDFNTLKSYDWNSVSKNNGLWLAKYGKNDGKCYKLPSVSPWKVCAIHQFTSKGSSIDLLSYVDRNVANMTYDAWERYAKGDRQ